MGSSTTGVSGSPEWTLSADEWKRLDQLDSRQFGFINLQDPADDASLRDRQILHKALRILEKRLLNDKKPDKKDNKDNKDKKDDKNEKNEKDEKDNKDDKDDKEAADTEDPDVYLKLGHIHLLSQDFAK
uniref:Uncharacterized protein n=1 Tax=Plectus sambesii TaxID=2011161 RepID=A0A914UYN0_9BILA